MGKERGEVPWLMPGHGRESKRHKAEMGQMVLGWTRKAVETKGWLWSGGLETKQHGHRRGGQRQIERGTGSGQRWDGGLQNGVAGVRGHRHM